MTVSGIEYDVDSIVDLDFDYAPPCEAVNANCDEVAEWKMVFSCCGKMVLYCDPHKKQNLTFIDRVILRGGRVSHALEKGGCGSEDVSYTIVERL